MLFSLIDYIKTANIIGVFSVIVTAAVLLLICMPVHECAHAWAAHVLGDDTAKYQGRLSLNPARHFDPIGALMIVCIGVGYAKPVPVNMMNFKNRKGGMALTAFAGPASNFIMCIIFIILTVLTTKLIPVASGVFSWILFLLVFVFSTASHINIALAIFNLIPIPPFDGSRILGFFLPDRAYYKIMQYEQIIFIVVMILLIGGFMSGPLTNFTNTVYSGLFNGISFLFSWL